LQNKLILDDQSTTDNFVTQNISQMALQQRTHCAFKPMTVCLNATKRTCLTDVAVAVSCVTQEQLPMLLSWKMMKRPGTTKKQEKSLLLYDKDENGLHVAPLSTM